MVDSNTISKQSCRSHSEQARVLFVIRSKSIRYGVPIWLRNCSNAMLNCILPKFIIFHEAFRLNRQQRNFFSRKNRIYFIPYVMVHFHKISFPKLKKYVFRSSFRQHARKSGSPLVITIAQEKLGTDFLD